MTEVRVQRAWSKLASSINPVRYVKRNKKKRKNKKKKKKKKRKNGFVVISTSAGFSKAIYKQLIPALYKREDGGKQERRNETTFMDLIRSNKKGLRHGRFCSFQCFKIWSDCLNFKHWPILSSASGALLIFTVNLPWIKLACYGNQQQQKKKKETIKKHRSDAVVCDIWSGRTRFGNSFIESGTDKPCWSKQKRGRKLVRSSSAFVHHSHAVKRPLIFWTRRLHLDVLQSQCIHTSHKRINYQTTVTDDSC